MVMRGCCGAWLPRCVVAAVIAGTGVRAVPAPGSGCVWVVPACVGFEAGTAGGPAARRCAYFVGRRGGGPVCWGSGFCFGRAGVCSVCGVCFVSLESASVFRCSLHAFAARAQVVCIFIRGRFRHASFLRVTLNHPLQGQHVNSFHSHAAVASFHTPSIHYSTSTQCCMNVVIV